MKNSLTFIQCSRLKNFSWKTILLAAVAAAAVPAAAQGQINILHSFYLPTDGENPGNSLIQSGGVLYGVTDQGPGFGQGTAFSLPIAGGADTILHAFVGGTSDGGYPLGSVALSGSTLYGVTQYGGAQGDGTIFSIAVGGGANPLVYSFSGGTADGSQPRGSLVVSGTSLYGMTYYGGTNNMGTVFSASTNGGPETVLYSFAGYATGDGQNPSGATGSLILSGSTLYGVTGGGGDRSGDGVVFSVPTTGGPDTILHTFNPVGTQDGLDPQGLLLSGTTLFGTTYGGGLGRRAVFSSYLRRCRNHSPHLRRWYRGRRVPRWSTCTNWQYALWRYQ